MTASRGVDPLAAVSTRRVLERAAAANPCRQSLAKRKEHGGRESSEQTTRRTFDWCYREGNGDGTMDLEARLQLLRQIPFSALPIARVREPTEQRCRGSVGETMKVRAERRTLQPLEM
jgi:hypothetical protein